MPLTGKGPPNEEEYERLRILRDGRALRHDMMLLLRVFSERARLSSLFNLDKLLQAVNKMVFLEKPWFYKVCSYWRT